MTTEAEIGGMWPQVEESCSCQELEEAPLAWRELGPADLDF